MNLRLQKNHLDVWILGQQKGTFMFSHKCPIWQLFTNFLFNFCGGMAEVGTTAGGAKERRYVKSIKKVMKKACFQTKTSLFGGDKRDRTADLMTASHALSRLVRLHTP